MTTLRKTTGCCWLDASSLLRTWWAASVVAGRIARSYQMMRVGSPGT